MAVTMAVRSAISVMEMFVTNPNSRMMASFTTTLMSNHIPRVLVVPVVSGLELSVRRTPNSNPDTTLTPVHCTGVNVCAYHLF